MNVIWRSTQVAFFIVFSIGNEFLAELDEVMLLHLITNQILPSSFLLQLLFKFFYFHSIVFGLLRPISAASTFSFATMVLLKQQRL